MQNPCCCCSSSNRATKRKRSTSMRARFWSAGCKCNGAPVRGAAGRRPGGVAPIAGPGRRSGRPRIAREAAARSRNGHRIQHELTGLPFGSINFGSQAQAMPCDRREHRLHVFRVYAGMSADQCPGAGCADQINGRPGRQPKFKLRCRTRKTDKGLHVVQQRIRNRNLPGCCSHFDQAGITNQRLQLIQ